MTHSGRARSRRCIPQLNQYHVVMEVDPTFWQSPDGLSHIYVTGANGSRSRSSAFTALRTLQHPAGRQPLGTVPFGHHLVQSCHPAFSLGDAVTEIQQAGHDMMLPASIHGNFRGNRPGYQDCSSAKSCW